MTTVTKAAKAAKSATPAKAAPKSAIKLSKSGQKLAPLAKDLKITIGKAKTVADYVASGGPRKYLARWISAGAIKVA